MAQYYQIVDNIDDLKTMYPTLNLDNVQLLQVGDDNLNSQQFFLAQDDQLVLNDGTAATAQLIYQQPQQQQVQTQAVSANTSSHYILQQEKDQQNTSQHHIFYTTDTMEEQMQQQVQQPQQTLVQSPTVQQSQIVLRQHFSPTAASQPQQQYVTQKQPQETTVRHTIPTQVIMNQTAGQQGSSHAHVIVQQTPQQLVLQSHNQGSIQQQQQHQQETAGTVIGVSQQTQTQQIVMRQQTHSQNIGQSKLVYTNQPRTLVFTQQMQQQQQQHQQQAPQQQTSQQQILVQQHQPSQSIQNIQQSPQQQSYRIVRQTSSSQTNSPTVANVIFASVQSQQSQSHQHQQPQQHQILNTNAHSNTQQQQQQQMGNQPQVLNHNTSHTLANRVSQAIASPRIPPLNRNPIQGRILSSQSRQTQSLSNQSTPNSSQVVANSNNSQLSDAISPTTIKSTRGRGRANRGRGARTRQYASVTANVATATGSPGTMVSASPGTSPATKIIRHCNTQTNTVNIQTQQNSEAVQTGASLRIISQGNQTTIPHTGLSLQIQRSLNNQNYRAIIGNSSIQRTVPATATTGTSTGQISSPIIKYRQTNATLVKSNALNPNNTTGNFPSSDMEDKIPTVVVPKTSENSSGNESSSRSFETTLTTYTSEHPEDDRKQIRLNNGRVMSLPEFKRLQRQNSIARCTPTSNKQVLPVSRVAPILSQNQAVLKALSQQQNQNNSLSSNETRCITTSGNTITIPTRVQIRGQSQQQIIQARNPRIVQEGGTQKSAKMLVILQNGEQRLITFSLPKESCTVQELLEQVGVSITAETNIQCVANRGGSIDYIVYVGSPDLPDPDRTNEYISAAERTLQLSKQTESSTSGDPSSFGYHSDQSCLNNTSETSDGNNISNENKESVPKLINGYLAVCQFCGYTGYDHARCERCRRIFPEEPKRIPSSTKNPGVKAEEERKRIQSELLNKAANKALSTLASSRGRNVTIGGIRGRGRGMGRVTRSVEAEPVILTLSSDEECDPNGSDEKSNQSSGQLSRSNSIVERSPFPFEPKITEETEVQTSNYERDSIGDVANFTDKLYTYLTCKIIRIGTLRYEPKEKVLITSRGIKIVAPSCKNANEDVVLNIYRKEIVKLVAHFGRQLPLIFIYTPPKCANYIRESLEMKPKDSCAETPYYNPMDRQEPYKRIVLQIDAISTESKSVIKSIFPVTILEEISFNDANELLVRSSTKDNLVKNENTTKSDPEAENIRQILIYPPGKGGISINTEDYTCLATDQYLNDIIIDFYLKYLHTKVLSEEQRQKTHIFSSFFYKRLTTITSRQRQADLSAAQKRHARVKNWTKNVNLFEKDFIIIPINEQSHWFLAIICFPRLKGPANYETLEPVNLQPIVSRKKKIPIEKKISLQIGNTTITPVAKREFESVCIGDDSMSERDEAEADESDLASGESDSEGIGEPPQNNSCSSIPQNQSTCDQFNEAIKQPLILIFDSLSGASRSRVVATLRDYLTCEYRMKIKEDLPESFTKLNMPGHCVKVPQQNNFTDCGLFLLQYVEHFFKDPISDYRLPIKQLVNWFETIVVTRKREEISNLIRNLVEDLNPEKLPLPEITFPTVGGKLIEQDDNFLDEQAEFEEEEMEDEFEEEDDEEANAEAERIISICGEKVHNGNTTTTITIKPNHLLKRTAENTEKLQNTITRKIPKLENIQ